MNGYWFQRKGTSRSITQLFHSHLVPALNLTVESFLLVYASFFGLLPNQLRQKPKFYSAWLKRKKIGGKKREKLSFPPFFSSVLLGRKASSHSRVCVLLCCSTVSCCLLPLFFCLFSLHLSAVTRCIFLCLSSLLHSRRLRHTLWLCSCVAVWVRLLFVCMCVCVSVIPLQS